MGLSNSVQSNQQPFLKINHPKFKHIKQVPENDIIRSIISVQNQSDYEQWESKLNKITNLDDEVILLPKAYQYTRKAICGSSGTIQIDYDNFPYLLADELINRRKQNKYFSEPEIWYLLYSLVTAAYDFQKINQRIGDVRPQNIFINDEGHIKISNLFSWPGEVSNYVKTVFDNQRTYLSPQQTESVREGQAETFINKYKSQSFTIGLTVLQTAMIKSLDYVYRHSKSFDYQYFNNILKQWWELKPRIVNQDTGQARVDQYSDNLKLTIAGLCEIKPEDRLSSDEVYNWLKVFHKEINQILPFQPGLPPYKNIKNYANYIKSVPTKINRTPPPNTGINFGNQAPINNIPNINSGFNDNLNSLSNDPRHQLFMQYGSGNGQRINYNINPNHKINQPLNINQIPHRQVYNNYSQMNSYQQPIPNQPNLSSKINSENYRQPTAFQIGELNKAYTIKPGMQPYQPQFIAGQTGQQPQIQGINFQQVPLYQKNYSQNVVKNQTGPKYGNQIGTNSQFLKQIDEQISKYQQQHK